MNKDEIKKGLTVCAGDSCDNCSYYKFHNCYDRLKLDARELIIKQEQEIEQLGEQIEELRNEKWDAQDDLDCYYYDEMPSKIKQAKIDVLSELRERVETAIDAYFNLDGGGYYLAEGAMNDIDELLKEYENESIDCV